MDCRLVGLVIALCMSWAAAERGYVMEFSRTLLMNASNTMYLSLYDVDAPGTVIITLLTSSGNTSEIAREELQVDEESKNYKIHFFVPDISDQYSAKLRMNGTFETEDDYTISAEDSVNLARKPTEIIFIQTDKPLYKPSQMVLFRVLRVDSRLRPIEKLAHADIYIQDPSGSRLAQWLDADLTNIEQYQFLLADEPVLGRYTISVSINGNIETTSFEVKEYVLPTFSVTIKPPPYVLADAETITLTICANYTTGKPVKGESKLNCSLENFGWSMDKNPVLESESDIDGCYTYVLNVSLIDQESYYSYRRIQVTVSVTEEGTGVVRNQTIYIDRTHQPLNLNFYDRQKNTFKPGLPYFGNLKVNKPDDTPAADEEIQICCEVSRERIISNWKATRKVKICKNYTSDDNGDIFYILPPQNTDTIGISIEAKSNRYTNQPRGGRATLSQPQASASLKPWYSKSGSFMQIQAVPDPFPCDTEIKIELLYTAKEAPDRTLHYQVINKGKVLTSKREDLSFDTEDVSCRFSDSEDLLSGDEIQVVPPASSMKNSSEAEDCPSAREARYLPPVGSISISIDVTADLSPDFYVLAYYIREDRETVADSQKFTIQKCFNNKVSLSFSNSVQQPGTKATLTLKASPDSLCGVKVVDKSVSLLDSSDQLTPATVFNALQRFDTGQYYPRNRCNEPVHQPGIGQKNLAYGIILPPRPWSTSSYEDSMTAYETAGFNVFSDFEIFTRPCKENEYRTTFAAYGGHGKGGAGPVALASVARRPAAPEADGASADMDGASLKSVKDVRTDFPETWLFDLVEIGEEGKLVYKETLPDTITEWVGSAVCLNSEAGLGISNTTSIKGFQNFFLAITLPYSFIRGEKLWIPVQLFNYIEDALPITLSVDESDSYIVTDGAIDGDVCVPGGQSVTRKFQIQATKLGTLNITVRAKTAESDDVCEGEETSDLVASDGVSKTVLVEPEGYPQEKVESVIFCPKDEKDGEFQKDFKLEVPDDVVADSARATLVVTGSIMGPVLQNLNNLVQLPTGCGEQNMAKFTPIISVLEYLAASGGLTDSLKTKAIGYLNSGYQREMRYRHSDGSYSAFGASDKEGSIFLTAFVVSSFYEAKSYIPIDGENLAQSQKWITSKQQDDGCFPEVGRTVDQYLKGGLGSKESTGLRTAYITYCLLTADYNNQTAIDSAISCMKENDQNMTAYSAAVYAYTAILSGDKDLYETYLDVVYKFVNETGDTVHFNNINGSNSLDTETAAFVVLAILKAGGSANKVLPIIRWMSTMRNSNGGFSSTQDTVMGLKAFAEMAKLLSKDTLDLTVSASDGINDELSITDEDKLLVNQYKISKVPSEVTVEATGSGCGLIQTNLRYNTESPPEKKFFSIRVHVNCITDDCSRFTIKVDTSYLPSGRSSNMAVVEIKMLSGTAPVRESIDQLVYPGSPVRRADFSNDNVLECYFDELKNEMTSFSFDVEKVFDVVDLKPATAKVYDYYAKENNAVTSYSLDDGSE